MAAQIAVPIFPLPDLTFFPHTMLPLHIFEARYRAMITDCLSRDQPAVALLIARLLAQRLNVANTYLADLMHQYAGQGNHLSMVGEILQSMINLPPSQVSPGSDRQSDPRV